MSPLKRSPMKRRYRSTGPLADAVDAVLERDQHSCAVCGQMLHGVRGGDWALHHRLPRRMGGSTNPLINLPSNLVTVDPDCHSWLESRREEAYDAGLILHLREIPSQTPVALIYGVVLLDNNGGFRYAA